MSGDIDPKHLWASITGQAPMPDRDPALEAALEKYLGYPTGWETWRAGGAPNNQMRFIAEGMWHAAFRSLGCATPEAVTALRELVVAATEETRLNILWAERQQESESAQHPERRAWVAAKTALDEAARAFARLATPTEEG